MFVHGEILYYIVNFNKANKFLLNIMKFNFYA